jgi:chloride channel protein, CIC family
MTSPAANPNVAPVVSLKGRQRHLSDFTTNPRVLVIAIISVIVATASVIAAVFLLWLIRIVTNFAYFGLFSIADLQIQHSPLGLWMVLVPVAGSLVVGIMARYGSEKIRGHGIPEAIEAILLGRSRLDAKVAILKPVSSAIAIGTGGPFGAEGPIIMTGGAIGSLIAQMLPVSDNERKTLLVAGAAAGMTAVFGTPIAAIMLAVELLLFEWTPRSFIPVAVAAIIAAVERSYLHLPYPLFPFAGSVGITALGLASWVLIGFLSGLLSCLLTQSVYACEDCFLKLPLHWMWWPLLGGLAVGIGGLIEPQALGVGYDNISRMLQGDVLPMAALLLLVIKAVIWSVALGSGTSGGVLAPLLIMGGAMGTALAGYLPAESPGFWALPAMAAAMGGTMRSPLTSTFFAVELTGNTHVLLPLITACGTAHLVTVLLMRRSILTEKVARRGHHLVREYQVDPFALTRAHEVMTNAVEVVPATMTLHEAAAFLMDPVATHSSFPVLDAGEKVVGVIDAPTVLSWRRAGTLRTTPLGELFAGTDVASAYSDEYLESVADRLIAANISHVPVISRECERLVGYIGWKDLMSVRTKLQAAERYRTSYLRTRFGRHRGLPYGRKPGRLIWPKRPTELSQKGQPRNRRPRMPPAPPPNAGGIMATHSTPHFHNQPGVPQVRIGVKEFKCVGAMPPFDHPHIFVAMGDDDDAVCPYCSMQYVFDEKLHGSCQPAECAFEPGGDAGSRPTLPREIMDDLRA